ncbi:MAG: hypothetical protein ABI742_09130 [Gemmatimonadota bacterium]
MRFAVRAFAAGLVLLLGCSDQQSTQPTAPRSFGGPTTYVTCPNIDQARALVKALYPAGAAQNTAVNQVVQLYKFAAANKVGDARAVMFNLLQTLLQNYFAGTLTGGQTTPTQTNVLSLVNGLYCVVGLPQPNLPLGVLGPDGAAAIVLPGTTTTLVRTATQFAAVNVPAASLPTPALVTITRLPDEPGPLLTPLDQYPAFYEFTASPAVTFNADVLVGVCQVASFTPPDYSRLKVGHNVGPTVELLPRTAVPFIDCTNLTGGLGFGFNRGWRELASTLFLPQAAEAATVATCCLGGTTKKFSPFGAVDTLAIIDPASRTIEGPANTPVTASQLPRVVIVTPTGRPVPGVTVTFAIPAGSQGSITGAVQITDATGAATLGGWTLGDGSVPNDVTATATPLVPGSGFANNPAQFHAFTQ